MTNIYQKLIVTATASVLGLTAIAANSAQAASFEFNYNFLSGNTLSGTVDGDLQTDGDTVRNLTKLRASYSGAPEQIFSFASFSINQLSFSGRDLNFYGFVAPPPASTTPIDDFGFALLDDGALNSATVGIFSVSSNGISFPFGTRQAEAEIFSPERWTLTQETAQPVPEPSTALGLSIFVLVGWLTKKKLRTLNSIPSPGSLPEV